MGRQLKQCTLAQLIAEWLADADDMVKPEPWRVHGPVRHCPFKENRRAIERREERRFMLQFKRGETNAT